jgi:hypothetical protein
MKRIILTVFVAAFAAMLYGQRNSIDDFFNRYSGMEGYNTVTINGNFFGLLKNFDDDQDLENLDRKVTSIRIVSRDGDTEPENSEFVSEIRNIIRRGGYEEMMTVKNSKDDVRFMVKTDGDIIKELLIVATGDDDAVIQIKGSLTREDVDRISENHAEGIARLEQLETTGK